MDRELFDDLELPQPAHHVQGVSDKPTYGGQAARMIEGCEPGQH